MLLSAASALGYTASNICLRDVATTCDPAWVSCIKAVPTTLVAWLLIARRASQGLPALPRGKLLAVLVVTALCMQIGGNVGFQWSLGVVGLAVSVPLVFGTLILGGALGGRVWLGEGISKRSALAILLLMLAIALLSWGADRHAAAQSATDLGQSLLALAVAVACFSGLCYSACNVMIRRVAGNLLPLSATLMVMSTTGVIALGLLSLWQIGWRGVWGTTPSQWTSMLLAGVFNAAAFFALGQALQAIPVTRSNLINSSQVALSSLAGVVLFDERLTTPMMWGVALTIAGLVLIQRRG
jgi:DME family drug/metabolite transporter